MPRIGHPSKYAPLVAWLQALPTEQHTAALTMTEIEAIIGAPLPVTAWSSSFWSRGTIAPVVWHAIGFRPRLNRGTRTVTFTRLQE